MSMDADKQSGQDVQALLAEWTPAVRRVAASYVAGDEREDLSQDILLGVWESLPNFREESSMRTFIYRIAHNRAIDFVRKRSNQPSTLAADHPTNELASGAPPADRVAEARCKKRRLVAAVRQLRLSWRQPLTMALDGLSYTEIAEILDISETNVGVRIHRARQRLKDVLETQETS
jgi:RNA polymerase sigma-70 factor (ECF subfamily)